MPNFLVKVVICLRKFLNVLLVSGYNCYVTSLFSVSLFSLSLSLTPHPPLPLVPSLTDQIDSSPTGQAAPSSTDQIFPSPTDQIFPSPTDQIFPSPTGQAAPSSTDQIFPFPTDQIFPFPTDQIFPSPTDETIPSPTDQIVPSPTDQMIPPHTDQIIPSTIDQTIASPTDLAAPSSIGQSIPSPTNQTIPSPTDQTIPSSSGQTNLSNVFPTDQGHIVSSVANVPKLHINQITCSDSFRPQTLLIALSIAAGATLILCLVLMLILCALILYYKRALYKFRVSVKNCVPHNDYVRQQMNIRKSETVRPVQLPTNLHELNMSRDDTIVNMMNGSSNLEQSRYLHFTTFYGDDSRSIGDNLETVVTTTQLIPVAIENFNYCSGIQCSDIDRRLFYGETETTQSRY